MCLQCGAEQKNLPGVQVPTARLCRPLEAVSSHAQLFGAAAPLGATNRCLMAQCTAHQVFSPHHRLLFQSARPSSPYHTHTHTPQDIFSWAKWIKNNIRHIPFWGWSVHLEFLFWKKRASNLKCLVLVESCKCWARVFWS